MPGAFVPCSAIIASMGDWDIDSPVKGDSSRGQPPPLGGSAAGPGLSARPAVGIRRVCLTGTYAEHIRAAQAPGPSLLRVAGHRRDHASRRAHGRVLHRPLPDFGQRSRSCRRESPPGRASRPRSPSRKTGTGRSTGLTKPSRRSSARRAPPLRRPPHRRTPRARTGPASTSSARTSRRGCTTAW